MRCCDAAWSGMGATMVCALLGRSVLLAVVNGSLEARWILVTRSALGKRCSGCLVSYTDTQRATQIYPSGKPGSLTGEESSGFQLTAAIPTYRAGQALSVCSAEN